MDHRGHCLTLSVSVFLEVILTKASPTPLNSLIMPAPLRADVSAALGSYKKTRPENNKYNKCLELIGKSDHAHTHTHTRTRVQAVGPQRPFARTMAYYRQMYKTGPQKTIPSQALAR